MRRKWPGVFYFRRLWVKFHLRHSQLELLVGSGRWKWFSNEQKKVEKGEREKKGGKEERRGGKRKGEGKEEKKRKKEKGEEERR